jgi:ATP-dependent DNA helicase Rep
MLNPAQADAVRHVHGPLLVLAGAGSGKTRVITEKIVHLIRDHAVPAEGIVAITFTNKAAREMRERVGKLLKGEDPAVREALTVSTFHAFGLNLLRREHQAAGLRRHFAVLDEDETQAIVREMLPKGTKNEDIQRWRGLISATKNRALDPAAAATMAKSPREREGAQLYADYQRRLAAFGALDFDDLILKPLQLLKDDAIVRERWQRRIRYLLVDEYQDTNDTQYALLKSLAGTRGAFTAVGDDDQSIYAWRGANPENLAQLQQDYPALTVIKLEQNYRCSGRILDLANRLIANNPHLFEKRLWSTHPAGSKVPVKAFDGVEDEAQYVASTISLGVKVDGHRPGQYAVLYRGNHQSRELELALRAASIPYHLSGGTSFFARQEIKDLSAYLRLLINPDDDVGFLRAVRNPRRDLGDVSLERLAQAAQARGLSLLSAIAAPGLLTALPPRAGQVLQRFAADLARWTALAETLGPGPLTERIAEDSGYRAAIKAQVRDPVTAERRLENITAFIQWLTNNTKGSGKASLDRVLTQLALADREEPDTGEVVRLMTLHSAKGLEFDHVFLVGLEDGTLPHQGAIDEGRLEEERRLLYVGITRARQTLRLTRVKKRKRWGEIEILKPSRFLDELPAEHLSAQAEPAADGLPDERARKVAAAMGAEIWAELGEAPPPARTVPTPRAPAPVPPPAATRPGAAASRRDLRAPAPTPASAEAAAAARREMQSLWDD